MSPTPLHFASVSALKVASCHRFSSHNTQFTNQNAIAIDAMDPNQFFSLEEFDGSGRPSSIRTLVGTLLQLDFGQSNFKLVPSRRQRFE